MRGGFLHNEIMVRSLRTRFDKLGASTAIEVPVRCGTTMRFIDLVARVGNFSIAVEVELDVRRVRQDVEKAAALEANELWVVVPDARLVTRMRRRLAHLEIEKQAPCICVCTYAQAIQRVTNCFPLIFGANALEEQFPTRRRSQCGSAGPI